MRFCWPQQNLHRKAHKDDNISTTSHYQFAQGSFPLPLSGWVHVPRKKLARLCKITIPIRLDTRWPHTCSSCNKASDDLGSKFKHRGAHPKHAHTQPMGNTTAIQRRVHERRPSRYPLGVALRHADKRCRIAYDERHRERERGRRKRARTLFGATSHKREIWIGHHLCSVALLQIKMEW